MTYLEFALAGNGAATRLTLTHRPIPARMQPQTMMGWHTFLDMLEAGALGEEVQGRGGLYAKERGALRRRSQQSAKVTMMTMDQFGKRIDDHTVQFERLLPGPVEKIWAYLTDGEKRGRMVRRAAPFPPRSGEEFELRFKHSELSPHKAPPPERFKEMDANGFQSKERLLALEPMRRLVHTFGEAIRRLREVEFLLTPEGNKVRLTLTHRKIPDRAYAVNISGGWHSHLSILQDEGGRQSAARPSGTCGARPTRTSSATIDKRVGRLNKRSTSAPLTDCQIASAARAAVSARRMRGPSVTGVTNGSARSALALRRIEAAFRAGENGGGALAQLARGFRQRPGIAALVAEKNPALARPGQPSSLSSATASPISGTVSRADCSAASTALARSRSWLTRVTMVRRVKTGCNFRAPSSVAFWTR